LDTNNHKGGDIVDRLLTEADKLYQMGLVQQAADTLHLTLEQFPGEKRARHALAQILIDGHRFDDALDLLKQIPDSDRGPRTLELTGGCLMGLGRLDESRACAGKLLSKNTKSTPGLSLMGRLATKQGDQAAAEDYFSRAIQSGPDHGSALVHLGVIKWKRGQTVKALDLIENGFSKNPTDMMAATTYHAVVTELGVFGKAEADFKAAVKNNPYNERLQHLLIDVLLQQQKYPAAFSQVKKALAVFGAGDGLVAAAKKVKSLAGQKAVRNEDKNACRLSVCMIVKNEAAHLARCLRSVEPVADEIVVVDTGSSDHSRDVAALFDARIFDFEWVDDFAKARNFSVSKACGEWVLSLDADEAISSQDHAALRKLVGQTVPKGVAYSIVTRNYMNRVNAQGWLPNDGQYKDEEAGYGWIPSEKVRLFQKLDGIRFEYPVHEMVEPALEQLGIEIRPCDIPVHHYGKLDERNSTAKGRRYYRIGLKKLAELDHNILALRELAIQAVNLEEYEDAVSLWQKVVTLQPEKADAYLNLGTVYWHLARYQEAVEAAQKAMELAPDLKEAPFNYCLSLLYLGHAQEAVPVLENLVMDFPAYAPGRFMLAASLCCAGQSLQGEQKLEILKHSQLGPGLAISCHTLAQGLQAAGQVEYARAVLNAAIQTDNASEEIFELLKTCKDTTGAVGFYPS
jgi:tetratricopeptide (TPR) repeat protein